MGRRFGSGNEKRQAAACLFSSDDDDDYAGVFGAFFAGFGLISEWRDGVIEAERVTPASRTALLMGRLWRDLLQLFVQAVVLVGLGYVLGMDASFGGAVLGVVLTLLMGGACAAASNALALTTKSEDVMAPVINVVMMPVLLLSGILLPMTIGPEWLRRASDFMPTRWIVDATRSLFGGDYGASDVVWGTGWAALLFALAVWWGTATFRRENQ